MSTFIPSQNQKVVFNTFNKTNKNIVVKAVPGSGKTTTIMKLIEMIPPAKKSFYGAFNKSIVNEIKEKIRKSRQRFPNLQVSTMHSLGMKTIRRNQRATLEVNNFKNVILFQKLNNDKNWNIKEDKLLFKAVLADQLVNHYKLSLTDGTSENLKALAEKFNIPLSDGDLRYVIELITYLEHYDYADNPSSKKMINFADMLYYPIRFNMPVEQFHELFIDECQDLNLAQQALAKKALKPGGRFVAVGDNRQSIYGFMGADEFSFEKFLDIPNTINLPLSVSYRCKSAIVEKANAIYDVIEIAEGNEGGEARDGSYLEIEEGDFVLCRNNAPLIEMYIELLALEKKAYIRGKDLGDQLVALVKPIQTTEEFKDYFSQLVEEFCQDLQSQGIKNPKDTKRYRSLIEKITILNILLGAFGNIQDLKDVLEDMFSEEDEREGVCLSTIHKAKGLEADNVFLLCPHLIPSPQATTPGELIQEENLRFVAITRAKNKIITITDFAENGVIDKTKETTENE